MAAAAKGMRPRAPTPSTWRGTPAARVTRAMSVRGCMVPISVHAAPIDTRVVSGRRARRTSSGLTRPSPSTGNTVTAAPVFSRSRQALSTEICSTADVITCRAPAPARMATPRMARLLASVAPEVKMTPVPDPPTRRATLARAASSDSRASEPSECGAEGLPMPASRKGRITASTRGSTGAKPA
jgi:hypothetical protein